MKYAYLFFLTVSPALLGAQCRAIHWQPNEIEYFKSLYEIRAKPGDPPKGELQDEMGDPEPVLRRQRIGEGMVAVAARGKSVAACLQRLWSGGASGFFWQRDPDARYHFLPPEHGAIAMQLQCVSAPWLAREVKTRGKRLYPKISKSTRFDADTQVRLSYESYLGILRSLDPPLYHQLYTGLISRDPGGWGARYFAQEHLVASPDDPLLLKHLDWLRKQAEGEPADANTNTAGAYYSAYASWLYTKRDADELLKLFLARPSLWSPGLNYLHDLGRDDLVDRYIKEAKLDDNQRASTTRLRDRYHNGDYDRLKKSEAEKTASYKWTCPNTATRR